MMDGLREGEWALYTLAWEWEGSDLAFGVLWQTEVSIGYGRLAGGGLGMIAWGNFVGLRSMNYDEVAFLLCAVFLCPYLKPQSGFNCFSECGACEGRHDQAVVSSISAW